jgi:hypothetical protein
MATKNKSNGLSRQRHRPLIFSRFNKKSVTVPQGGYAILINDEQTFLSLLDALADAETFTGRPYTDILFNLEQSRIIKN